MDNPLNNDYEDGHLVDPWVSTNDSTVILCPTFCRWCEADFIVTSNDYDICPNCDTDCAI